MLMCPVPFVVRNTGLDFVYRTETTSRMDRLVSMSRTLQLSTMYIFCRSTLGTVGTSIAYTNLLTFIAAVIRIERLTIVRIIHTP